MRSLSYMYPFIVILLVVLYNCCLNVTQSYFPVSDTCLSQFWSKPAILHDFNLCVMDLQMDERMDGWIDGRKDKASYREERI